MRRRLFNTAALLLAATATATLLGACKASDSAGNQSTGASQAASKSAPSSTGTTQVDADGVRRVTVAELQAMLTEGRVAIYDTRGKESYDAEHIKGALSMPVAEVAARAGELPKDTTLVFYCT